MKITSKVQLIRGVLGNGIFIPCPHDTDLNGETEYVIDIHKPKKKRSLTANAYCWVLCQKIAERLTVGGTYHSKEDVYRKCIKDCGHFVTVPVRDDIVDEWCRRWGNQGIGWISENLGACRNTPNYTLVAMYHGSSTYTVDEMIRLIDCLIDEAERLGVETKPQAEIDSLMNEWGRQYEQT
jgi:hypothetical protein